jgi:FkbM family methyltransferase
MDYKNFFKESKILYSFIEYLRLSERFRKFTRYIESKITKCPQNDLQLQIIGGKLVSKRLLSEGGIVVSAGVGTDLDFEYGIIDEIGCNVIALDPTQTSQNFVSRSQKVNKKLSTKLKFLNLALSADGQNLDFFSGDGDRMASTTKSHSIGNSNQMVFKSASLNEILRSEEVAYLKLDIEGYEYTLLENMTSPLTIPQVAIEFHHFCIPERSLTESIKWIEKFESWGYTSFDFGSWAGRSRKLPRYTSLFSDLNVEILFVKIH